MKLIRFVNCAAIGLMISNSVAASQLTTRLERTVESLFVYRSSQSAAAQPERYVDLGCLDGTLFCGGICRLFFLRLVFPRLGIKALEPRI